MKNPIQPLANDEHSTLRFKANAIVRHLIDTHPNCSLNALACLDFNDDDRQQFAQLIGYSLSGYGDLSYVDDVAYDTAAAMATSPLMSEDKAKIAALESQLSLLQEAINALRKPMAVVLGMHPDDLAAN